MPTHETRELAENYLNVLNRVLSTKNFDLLATIAVADFVDHGVGVGLESWIKMIAGTLRIFPDMQLHAETLLADGDTAAIRSVLRGTHLGEGLGIPPTGKPIALNTIIIVRFQKRLAVERWLYIDDRKLMPQLGMVSAPGN